MSLMLDKELRAQIAAGRGPVEGLDPALLATAIVGCAIDLHVGDIFRPDKKDGKPGSATVPNQLQVTLKEGETAVVRTLEKFKLAKNQAALVFPATSVSIQGLLMTNPGHVDPGYEGPVHVTAINMSRAAFGLKKGDRLLRALVYQLSDNVDSTPTARATPLVTQELLEKLSPDFLSVNNRTAEAAKREMNEAAKQNQLLQYGLPAFATLVGIAVTSAVGLYTTNNRIDDRIRLLEEVKASNRLTTLEEDLKTEKRFQDIEAQVKALQPVAAPASAAVQRGGGAKTGQKHATP